MYRCIPDRTMTFRNDKRKGCKKVKDRVTVLITASMMGEKKRPLVIGKSHNPRCFKNVKTLPVDYKSQNSSWMTQEIYVDYLTKWDDQKLEPLCEYYFEPLTRYFYIVICHSVPDQPRFEPITELNHYQVIH